MTVCVMNPPRVNWSDECHVGYTSRVWVVAAAAGARASRDRWHSPGLLRRHIHTHNIPALFY